MSVKLDNIKVIVDGTKNVSEIKVNIDNNIQDIKEVVAYNAGYVKNVIWSKDYLNSIYLKYKKVDDESVITGNFYSNDNNPVCVYQYSNSSIGSFTEYMDKSFDTYFDGYRLLGYYYCTANNPILTDDDEFHHYDSLMGQLYSYDEITQLIVSTDFGQHYIYAVYLKTTYDVIIYTQHKNGEYGVFNLYKEYTNVAQGTSLSSLLPESLDIETCTYVYRITPDNGWCIDYHTNQQGLITKMSTKVVEGKTFIYTANPIYLTKLYTIKYMLNIYYYLPSANSHTNLVTGDIYYNDYMLSAIQETTVPDPEEYLEFLYTNTTTYRLGAVNGIVISETQQLSEPVITSYADEGYRDETIITYHINIYNDYVVTGAMYEFHLYDDATGEDIIGPIQVLKGTVLSNIANLNDLYDQIASKTYSTSYEDSHYNYTYMIIDELDNSEVQLMTIYTEITRDICWMIKYTRTPKSYTITFVDDYDAINTDYPAYRNTVYTTTLKYGETYSLPESVYNSYSFNEPIYEITEDGVYRLDNRYKDSWYNEEYGDDYFINTTETKIVNGDTTYIRIVSRAIAQSTINIVDNIGVFDGSYDNYYYENCSINNNIIDFIQSYIQFITGLDNTNYIDYTLKDFKMRLDKFDGSVIYISCLDIQALMDAHLHGDTTYFIEAYGDTQSGGIEPWYIFGSDAEYFKFFDYKNVEFILTGANETPQTVNITYYDFDYNRTIKTYNKGTIINTISDQPTSVGVLSSETFAYWSDITDSIDLNSNDDFFLSTQPLTQSYTLYAFHNRQDISRYTNTYPQGAGVWARTVQLDYSNGWFQIVDYQGNFIVDTIYVTMPGGYGSIPSELLLFYTTSNNLRIMPAVSLDSSTGEYKVRLNQSTFSKALIYNTAPYKATSLVFTIYPYDSSNTLLSIGELSTLSLTFISYIDGVQKEAKVITLNIIQGNDIV